MTEPLPDWLRATDAGVELRLKVVPGASRNRLLGPLGDELKLAVAAPPEDGKANKAVIATLAEVLGVRRTDIALVSGQTQAHKRVRIAGVRPGPITRAVNASTPRNTE